MTRVECRDDGLYITIDNREYPINGDYRIASAEKGIVIIKYGYNYSQTVTIEVAKTKYANTQALLSAN